MTITGTNSAGEAISEVLAPHAAAVDLLIHNPYPSNDPTNEFPPPFHPNTNPPGPAQVAFDAGWDGGNITIFGFDENQLPVSDVISPIIGGGTATGTQVFSNITAAVKDNAGNVFANATIYLRSVSSGGTVAEPEIVSTISSFATVDSITKSEVGAFGGVASVGTPNPKGRPGHPLLPRVRAPARRRGRRNLQPLHAPRLGRTLSGP